MAIPVWPAMLPELIGLQDGLNSDQLYSPPRETQFDDGPPRMRRKQLFQETPRSIAIMLSYGDELENFYNFVTLDLNNGAKSFFAPVYLRDGSTGVRKCRISGPVAESPQAAFGDNGLPLTRVSFRVMIENW